MSSGMLGKRHFQRPLYRFPQTKQAKKPSLESALEAGAGTSEANETPLQADEVRPGDMVTHPQFGSGLIVSLNGTLATIAFKRSGVKKMMLGIAPLRRA